MNHYPKSLRFFQWLVVFVFDWRNLTSSAQTSDVASDVVSLELVDIDPYAP